MRLLPQILGPTDYKPFPTNRMVRYPKVLPRSNAILGLEFEYERTGINQLYWTGKATPLTHEVELITHLKLLKKWYNVHVDPSLRGDDSIELVFKRGFTIPTAERAISELFNIAVARDFRVSRRTGLHVHLNMGECNRDHLRNLCALYAILEPSIYHAAGGERSANPFCVPWFYDGFTTKNIRLLTTYPDAEIGVIRRLKKYSGLNLKTLWKYSTVEFRHLRNTLDLNLILEWLRLIINLYEFCRNPDFETIFNELVFEKENYVELINVVYRGQRVWDALIFPDLVEEINTTPIIIASEIFLSDPLYKLEGAV